MKDNVDLIFCTWLTRTEAAAYYKCCPATISRIAREMSAKGYPVAVGRQRGKRYCKEAMDEYLLERGQE